MPHTTRCLFFEDSDTEADVIWYPALPTAELLDTPSMVSNSYLDPDGFFFLPGGEVYGAPREFNGLREKPGALGGHVCGTPIDFAEGCKLDNDAPAVQYRTDGLPSCCGAAVVAAGGGAVGGAVAVHVDNTVPMGDSCAAAPLLAVGQFAESDLTLTNLVVWARYPSVIGVDITVRATQSTNHVQVNVWEGTTCAGLSLLNADNLNVATRDYLVTPTATGFVYVEIAAVIGTTLPCHVSAVFDP